jgi:branched-chain amino acid transport system permease protein
MINFEVLFNGIILGSLYGLMSCGYSLIYGVGKVSNLAYGHLYMLSTFLGYLILSNDLGLLVAIPFVVVITIISGIITQYLLEKAEGEHSREIFLSLGIAIILENLLLAYFGGSYRFGPSYIFGTIDIGDIRIATYRVIIFVLSLAMFLALSIIVAKTRLGKSMRAVSQDEDASWLMGVDVGRVKLITGGIAGGLAAAAALLLLPIYPIYPAMGWEYLLVGFAIVILGGMGSINGTLLGGIILGASESLFGYYISAGLRGALYFVTIIIVILIKPEGLFGKKEKGIK